MGEEEYRELMGVQRSVDDAGNERESVIEALVEWESVIEAQTT